MKRRFKIDLNKEIRTFKTELLVYPTITFFLFLFLGDLIFASIMSVILTLIIIIRFKLITNYFILEYELDEEKLKLRYTEKGIKKQVQLQNGRYKVEKDLTVLYGRPGKKMTISWNEGTIYQYCIGDWNYYKMKELIDARR